MEEETRVALGEVEEAIGALSDLRHGRFAQSASGEDIVEQVLENLKKLEAVCANPAR
jgi:centromere-localized protein 2